MKSRTKVNLILATSFVFGIFTEISKFKNKYDGVRLFPQVVGIVLSICAFVFAVILLLNYEKLKAYWEVESQRQEMNFRLYFVFGCGGLLMGAGSGYIWFL